MKKALCLALLSSFVMTGSVFASDQVRIAGSSTVFPFASKAAEIFGQTSSFKAPIYESTGTGGGFKRLCTPDGGYDAAGASRPIKQKEFKACQSKGIDLTEIQIGIDGLSLANSRSSEKYDLTREQIFLALAKEIPANGQMVANPYKKWSDIDPSLPNADILVYGPPTTSGTRDAFVNLIMKAGAKAAGSKNYKTLREDGLFQEAGENDNLIVQKLNANPEAMGIFGFSFLEENMDIVQGVTLEGVEPTFDNILSRSYPAWRPLFLYVKTTHISKILGLSEYLTEILSDKASGEDGYLVEKGLIPLSDTAKSEQRMRLQTLAKFGQ